MSKVVHHTTRWLWSLAIVGLVSTPAAAEPEPMEPARPVDVVPLVGPTAQPISAPLPRPEPVAPVPVEPAPEPAPTAGYDKGFFIQSRDGNYQLKLGGRLQLAFVGKAADSGGTDTRTGAFSFLRAQFSLSGRAFGDLVSYRMMTEYSRGFAFVREFYVDAKLGEHTFLRAGQWKRPFSRQQINSSGKLSFVDRAITDKAFGNGRDLGIALHNDYEAAPKIEWIVGVFNGGTDVPTLVGDVDPDGNLSGSLSNATAQMKPVMVGRLGYNHGKFDGYSESDLTGGPLRYGVAASVYLEGEQDDDNVATHRAELDMGLKQSGFALTAAGYLALSGSGVFESQGVARWGAHVQASQRVNGPVHVAARYAIVDGVGGDTTPLTHEVGVGGSWFIRDHNFKLQGDISAQKHGDAGFTDDLRLLVAGLLSF